MKQFGMGVVAALAILAVPAQAKIVRIDLTGSIYQLSGAMGSAFVYGQAATASLRYDTTSPGQSFSPGGTLDPAIRYYPNAPTSGWVKVGAYKVELDAARIFVTNNESPGIIDRFIYEDTTPQGAPIAGLEINNLFFNWQDNSATALSNLDLPTTAATFQRLGLPRMAIDWGPLNNASNRVSVAFTSAIVSDVPEPGTWVMMIVGFGLVGLRRRQQRTLQLNIAS